MDWLKQSNAFVHLICTGGGAGAQQRLWSIPGASSYLSGASFPYSHAELEETLGFNPHSACSPEAAVDLASVAYQRASIGRGNRRAIGLGLTATASTLRTLKGGIRGHACALTDDGAIVTSLVISGSQSRREDGEAHDRLALETLRQAIEGGPIEDGLAEQRFFARPFFTPDGTRLTFVDTPGPWAMMPGAFNPLHLGHTQIAREVERRFGLDVVFMVEARTPHKAELRAATLLRRARWLRGHRALFTHSLPLYLDKARAFPGVPIVLGSDALERMLEPGWGVPISDLLQQFRQLGTRFLVAPRFVDGRVLTVDEVCVKVGIPTDPMFVELNTSSALSSSRLRASDPAV